MAIGHYESALRLDPASDDAALELMIALQHDRRDVLGARACVAAHIDGCAAARRPCRWSTPWQRPGVYASPLLRGTGRPWHDPADHAAVCGVLLDALPMIRAEFLELYGGAGGAAKRAWPRAGAEKGSSSDHGLAERAPGRSDDPSWREVVLVQRAGSDAEVSDDAARCCPRTIALLHSLSPIREAAELGLGEVVLAAVGPGTALRGATGATDLRLTAHLTLLAPTTARDCTLRVGDPKKSNATRHYVEGGVLLFDDSHEHASVHDGDPTSGDRVVLAVQFFHPKLTKQTRASEIRNALEAVQRRTLKTQFGSLATENAIRNAAHEAMGNGLVI